MTDNLDARIRALLAGWQPPAPHDGAIERLLAATQRAASAVQQPERPLKSRILLVGGPVLAAALVLGVFSQRIQQPLPTNEPALQQAALSVFSIHERSPDAEDLP